jgi:hypothetical protein
VGICECQPAFSFPRLRGTYVFSEWEHGYLLDLRLVRFLPWPVLTTSCVRSAGKTWVLAIRPFCVVGCHTEFGKVIVAHQEDFSRHNPIDRWWGGTRLTNDRLWRWNPALVAP